MVDYIQCTHCGKRYAVSGEIRDAEGQFTVCQACKEKFIIVVHSPQTKAEKLLENEDVVSTGDWDPSLTMPKRDRDDGSEENQPEQFVDNEDDDDGAQIPRALQTSRKKKQRLYIAVGLGGAMLLTTLWFVLMNEEVVAPPERATEAIKNASQMAQSVKVHDANNGECRQAAAQKWLIDYRAMHSNYSGEEFVRILKMSDQQTVKVHQFCKNKTIIQDIVAAATAQEKPDWLKAEIQMLEDNHKR